MSFCDTCLKSAAVLVTIKIFDALLTVVDRRYGKAMFVSHVILAGAYHEEIGSDHGSGALAKSHPPGAVHPRGRESRDQAPSPTSIVGGMGLI